MTEEEMTAHTHYRAAYSDGECLTSVPFDNLDAAVAAAGRWANDGLHAWVRSWPSGAVVWERKAAR